MEVVTHVKITYLLSNYRFEIIKINLTQLPIFFRYLRSRIRMCRVKFFCCCVKLETFGLVVGWVQLIYASMEMIEYGELLINVDNIGEFLVCFNLINHTSVKKFLHRIWHGY